MLYFDFFLLYAATWKKEMFILNNKNNKIQFFFFIKSEIHRIIVINKHAFDIEQKLHTLYVL